jgi:hypothetical protein
MRFLAEIGRGARETMPHNAEPHPTKVMPFGQYGGGLLTGHPIGLFIVLGILFVGWLEFPRRGHFSWLPLHLGRFAV